jgi:hypothetical protein
MQSGADIRTGLKQQCLEEECLDEAHRQTKASSIRNNSHPVRQSETFHTRSVKFRNFTQEASHLEIHGLHTLSVKFRNTWNLVLNIEVHAFSFKISKSLLIQKTRKIIKIYIIHIYQIVHGKSPHKV